MKERMNSIAIRKKTKTHHSHTATIQITTPRLLLYTRSNNNILSENKLQYGIWGDLYTVDVSLEETRSNDNNNKYYYIK